MWSSVTNEVVVPETPEFINSLQCQILLVILKLLDYISH